MTVRLGMVMDPPAKIHYEKDSTLAMLWEAAHRGWEIFYLAPEKIFLQAGVVHADAVPMQVFREPGRWHLFGQAQQLALHTLDLILVRKDPPFDVEYLYLTQLLEVAEAAGVRVLNRPQALRDANEKLFAQQFPQCCPPTLVTADKTRLMAFLQAHQDIVCKPLHGMGGESIFRLRFPDENASVVFETLSGHGRRYMMAQRYLPAIAAGDRRILMIAGEPFPQVLARFPAKGELRGNLAAGGKGIAQPLSARERWIAGEVGPMLREKGLFFVGLDVIGDWLIEINVTSPTCIREIDAQTDSNIAAVLLDAIMACPPLQPSPPAKSAPGEGG